MKVQVYIWICICIIIVLTWYNSRIPENFTTYTKCKSRRVSGLLKQIFDNYDIGEFNKENELWDIYIPCGYNRVEQELKDIVIDNAQQKIFGISGCDYIVSKNSLWSLLEQAYGRKEAKKIMPESFVISNPVDLRLFKMVFDKNKKYILKKNIQRKKGLKITNNLNEILNSGNEKYRVIQEFKIDSFIINKRAMNLRIYMLIVCRKNTTKIYINKLGKCLYTAKDIDENNKYDFDSRITNSYNVDKNIYNQNPLTLNDLKHYLLKNGHNANLLFSRIDQMLLKVSKAIIKSLCKLESIKDNLKFQLFGLDVIFNDKMQPFILEINKGPDMVPKDDKDKRIKIKVELDMLQKINVIKVSDKKYRNDFYKLYEKN